MEEISVLGLVATTLATTRYRPAEDAGLFDGVFMPRYRCWRGLLLSVSLHCFVIWVVIPLAYLLPESEQAAWKRHAQTLHPIRLQIPDRLYLSDTEPAPKKPPAEPPAPKKEALPAPKELAKADLEAAQKSAGAVKLPPRQFRLPDLPKKLFSDQTLIQPDLPPDLPLTENVKLPQLFLAAPVLPRPVPKRFVEPGPSAPPDLAPVKLETPPQLAAASEDQQDVQIASMLTGPEEALLRIPRPAREHRTFRPTAPGTGMASGRGASISPNLGEPLNILAYSTNPAQLKDRITIPLGNQIGQLPGPPPPPDADGPVGIPGAGLGTGRYPSGAGGPGLGTGAMAGGTGNGPGGIGTGGRNGAEANGGNGGGGVGSATASSVGGINYSTPIRIEHPSNGVFDVVVVQSSVEEGFPESAGVLTGRPVYTVYVQVGAPRPWLMQYCVPKDIERGPQVVGSTVYIGKPSPLKAPFPLVTVLPPVTTLPRTTYIMVHGFVDKGGRFKELKVLRAPGDQISELILPQLAQWHFRPATRDGVPILVEILLAIPPHEG